MAFSPEQMFGVSFTSNQVMADGAAAGAAQPPNQAAEQVCFFTLEQVLEETGGDRSQLCSTCNFKPGRHRSAALSAPIPKVGFNLEDHKAKIDLEAKSRLEHKTQEGERLVMEANAIHQFAIGSLGDFFQEDHAVQYPMSALIIIRAAHEVMTPARSFAHLLENDNKAGLHLILGTVFLKLEMLSFSRETPIVFPPPPRGADIDTRRQLDSYCKSIQEATMVNPPVSLFDHLAALSLYAQLLLASHAEAGYDHMEFNGLNLLALHAFIVEGKMLFNLTDEACLSALRAQLLAAASMWLATAPNHKVANFVSRNVGSRWHDQWRIWADASRSDKAQKLIRHAPAPTATTGASASGRKAGQAAPGAPPGKKQKGIVATTVTPGQGAASSAASSAAGVRAGTGAAAGAAAGAALATKKSLRIPKGQTEPHTDPGKSTKAERQALEYCRAFKIGNCTWADGCIFYHACEKSYVTLEKDWSDSQHSEKNCPH